MADVTRWSPFQEMTTLRDAMNQLFAESVVQPRGWSSSQLPLDLYETENAYVVKLAAPGLQPNSFEIFWQQNALTIRGHMQEEQPEGARYHVKELRWGEFTRSLQFPTTVNPD